MLKGIELSAEGYSSQLPIGADHVVFLGVYNPNRFRARIEKWLPELDLTDCYLVVSDNHSSDDSLEWFAPLLQQMGVQHRLVRLPSNYGGYGNLASNLNFMSSARWVTTLHQDDFYLSNHVQNHRKVIASHQGRLGMVYSEAISEDESGRLLSFPRAHWLLENEVDPVTIFLAHLRNHAFPFSGATFSIEALQKYPIPWHSTAFPDTELVMKMIVEFEVSKAQQKTVRYLENPLSESHSLSPEHRDFGAFQALVRVFAHPNYKRICDLVSDDELGMFLESIELGIQERFGDQKLASLMKQAALELTAGHRGKTDSTLAQSLLAGYQEVDDKNAISVLVSLGAKPESSPNTKFGGSAKEVDPILSVQTKSRVLAISSILPGCLRRLLFRLLMATPIGKRLLPAWDFDWKGR